MSEGGNDNVDWRLLHRMGAEEIHKRLSGIAVSLGGSGSGGGVDAWQQSVESRLAQLHTDLVDVRGEVRALGSEMGGWFRWLIGLLVISFAAMLGVMARGFGWV
jgi:hypothetical protein